jgi:thioredoxin-related protein
MFDCKKVSMMVSESMDRKFPIHRRLLIAAHLLMCKYCNRFKKQLQILRHAVGLEDIHEEVLDRFPTLSKETREQIKLAMRDFSPDPKLD